MRILVFALAGVLLLGRPGLCGPPAKKTPPAKPAAASKPAPPTSKPSPIDPQKWPKYPGAEQISEVSLSGDQLAGLAGAVPHQARAALGKLLGVIVLEFKLPATAQSKDVLAFYEPHVLKAGFKVMVKSLEPGDTSGVYTGPDRGIFVISIEGPEGARKLEIVSVRGDLAGLAGLSRLAPAGKEPLSPAAPAAAPPPSQNMPDPDQ